MRIEKISIKDYRGIEDISIVPKKINVFTGKMGSGKSSCMQAIAYALTGESALSPIRNGATQAEVVMNLFGGKEIRRIYGKKSVVKVEGKATTIKSVNKLLEDTTGIKLDTMKVMTSSTMLATMKAGTLADFLLSNNLIPAVIDFNKMLDLCPFSADAISLLSMFLPEAPESININMIDDAYKEIYGMRTEVKRNLASAKLLAEFEGPAPTRRIEDVDKENAMVAVAAEKQRMQEKQLEEYNRAVEKRKKALEKLEQMRLALPKDKVVEPDPARKQNIEQQIAKLNDQINDVDATLITLQRNTQMFSKTLQDLDAPVCPLSDKLVCSTDKSKIKDELLSVIKENQAETERLSQKKIDLVQKKRVWQEEIEKFNQAMTAYQSGLLKFKEYEICKNNLPPVPEKPKMGVVAVVDAKRIEELKEERKRILAYKTAQENSKRVAELEEKIAVLNEIIDKLSPKGDLHDKILEYVLTPIEEHCNKRAADLKMDFKIGIRVENGVHLMCHPSAKAGYLDLANASSGEQLCATFLILDMLNSLSGFGVLLMDDLDKLSQDAFDALLSLMEKKEVLDSYDHIFIATVNHTDCMDVIDKHKGKIELFRM